jgi:hypothetical protein
MTPKRILVPHGHPAAASRSDKPAGAHADAARLRHLTDLPIDDDTGGDPKTDLIGSDLDVEIETLRRPEHIVGLAPMWPSGRRRRPPSPFDQALPPGRSVSAREPTALGGPKPLRVGGTARFVAIADMCWWQVFRGYDHAISRQIKHQIVALAGIRPVRVIHLVGVIWSGQVRLPRRRRRMRGLAQGAG